MTAADALRDFISPVLPGWRLQFGRWMDGSETARYCVIRPVGGLPMELVREPQFSVAFIGGKNDTEHAVSAGAEAVISAMQIGSGAAVYFQPSEPIFIATSDGRPMFELAVSAIFNLN